MTRELIKDVVNTIREATLGYTRGPLFTDNLTTPQQQFKKLSGTWVDRSRSTSDKFDEITDDDCVIINNWYKLSTNDQQKCRELEHVRVVHDDALIENVPNAEFIYTAVNTTATSRLVSNSKTVLFLGNMSEKVAQKNAGPGIDIRCYPLIPKQEGLTNVAVAAAIYVNNLESFKRVYVAGMDKRVLTPEEQVTVNSIDSVVIL